MKNSNLIKISLAMPLLFLLMGCAENNHSSGAQPTVPATSATSSPESTATSSPLAETPSSTTPTVTESEDPPSAQSTTAIAQTSSSSTPTGVANEPTTSAVVTPVTPSATPNAPSAHDAVIVHNKQEAVEFLWDKEFQRNSDILVDYLSSSPDQRGMTQYFLMAHSQSIQKNGGTGTVGKYWLTSDGHWGLED